MKLQNKFFATRQGVVLESLNKHILLRCIIYSGSQPWPQKTGSPQFFFRLSSPYIVTRSLQDQYTFSKFFSKSIIEKFKEKLFSSLAKAKQFVTRQGSVTNH